MLTLGGSLIVALSLTVLGDTPRPDATAPDDFEGTVRPLLSARCFKCHGPRKQQSGLRLDSRAAILAGGDTGPAIVPGKPDESLLVQAIRHEGDVQMPPGAKLGAEQVAALVRWIERGAPWPDDAKPGIALGGKVTPEARAFWSFRPIEAQPAPGVEAADWVRSPIDRFILARLEAAGIKPVGPADKRTLIRRATFDLTGLPPTVEEVGAFLADESPEAFARVVDRLLASPAYGERWGRHWLDVVRYADTAGETADFPVREAYKYRNYVIDAFNRDKPYDEFIREQVAGDVLAREGARERFAERVTATGFIAISRRFGFDSENYHHLTIQDTIDTMGQAVLGLTLGCARCHDHKFDPISTEDYYALYGIFASTQYPFPGSEQKPAVRLMAALVPPAEARPLRDSFDRNLAAVERALETRKLARPRVTLATLDDLDGDFGLQAPSAGGSKGCLVPPWIVTGGPEVTARAQSPFTNLSPRKGAAGVSLPNDTSDAGLGRALRPPWNRGLLHVNLDFRIASKGERSHRFYLGHGSGRSLAVEVFVDAEAIRARRGDSLEMIRTLQSETWYNLQLVLDLDKRTYSGTVGVPGDLTTISDQPFAPGWDGTIDYVLIDGGTSSGVRPALDVDNLGVREMAIPPPPGDLPAVEEPDPETRYAALLERGPCEQAYAVAEGTPQDAQIQKRGEPTKLGKEVPRRFPEILGGDRVPPDAEESGRRQLADWLTRPENPLTARVMVNRIWQHHFGIGLVATENDFGIRGKAPTHPALLDDLALRFSTGGWSVKAMHRLIMLSATYQLASFDDPRNIALDPNNELLWRFRRRRLDAESIRDALLVIGGNLDRTMGEAHPFPPVGTPFTQHNPFAAEYQTNRRSVYLMTRRSGRQPFLALFDGADTNATTARRSPTLVPTQALYFMNDPFVHEQSARFARQLLADRGDDAGRIGLAHQVALAREPRESESRRALVFLERYRGQLEAAGVPAHQHAEMCWSAFARTLFASSEFLFID